LFVVLEIGTRRIVHWNVTRHPSAAWTAQQFPRIKPGDQRYRYVLHDRDSIFSEGVDRTLTAMALTVLKTAARAPQANAFCELVIGTMRRECLDFMIPLHERLLRWVLCGGLRMTITAVRVPAWGRAFQIPRRFSLSTRSVVIESRRDIALPPRHSWVGGITSIVSKLRPRHEPVLAPEKDFAEPNSDSTSEPTSSAARGDSSAHDSIPRAMRDQMKRSITITATALLMVVAASHAFCATRWSA
jgi:hypothetical protein